MSSATRTSTFVVLSAEFSASAKKEIFESAFESREDIQILNQSTIVLTDEQQSFFPFDNKAEFCNGSVIGYHYARQQNVADLDFEEIIRLNKFNKEEIFNTNDTYFITKLKQIFFTQRKPLFTQSTIVCSPPLTDEHLNEISAQLKIKGIFVLRTLQNISSALYPSLKTIFAAAAANAEDEQKQQSESEVGVDCSIILCEAFDCVDQLSVLIGTENMKLCAQFAADSWNHKYSSNAKNEENNQDDADADADTNNDDDDENRAEATNSAALYKWHQLSAETEIEKIVKLNTLQTERTLALIKPTAVLKGYSNEIFNDIENHGFTIIAKKQIHLNVEHARTFYKEHNGRPFFDELTEFMSSGAIYALVLERVSAIKCWRTLLGPTNTSTAQTDAPQSIRGRFGSDQTANACHGSDSTQSAKREIKFYFPEIASNNVKRQPKSKQTSSRANSVQEYMSQILPGSGINETLQQFLVRGLSTLAETKPGSKLAVVEWFAQWLLTNNPNQPLIDEPEVDFTKTVAFTKLSFTEKMQYLNNDQKELQIVFVLGGPGSGKGTQCQKIIDTFGYAHISVGDLCRKVRDDPTSPESAELREIIASGKLVSSEFILKLLEKELLSRKGHKFLLDGFPRNLDQCIMFETQLCKCKFAINFDCTDEMLMERCLARGANAASDGSVGRADDNRETIEKRLNTFHEETDQVIEYLRKNENIRNINAMQPIEQIWKNVQKIHRI